MKGFLKTTLASFLGICIYSVLSITLVFFIIGAIASIGNKTVIMPSEAVLTIDFSEISISEQTTEAPLIEAIRNIEAPEHLGILSAVAAINAATFDPAVKFIFIKPDEVSGGIAQIEEVRNALLKFRESGKAVVAYMENPTNGGYYLASASDKIYMTPYAGGMNMFNGLSSQMIFLKDALDKLDINVQLIRHGKYKSAGEMYIRNSSSKENMEQNTAMIASMWSSWRGEIAQARCLSPERIDEMLDNLELEDPQDFLEKGLVDELVTRDQLQEKLAMLYMTENYKDVKSISLADYSQLHTAGNPLGSNKIAVIYAEGNIVDGNSIEDVAGDRFARIIQSVREDDDVKAVVLRVNSPGGSVLASEKIKAQIDSLQTKVPVIASYGDYAASGGYWISAGCDFIYSDKTTLTGSIGVFSMIPDFQGTVRNKLNINITAVNSNEHADMYGMMRPLTQQEEAYMQKSVENIYDKFTALVSKGRGMEVSEVDNIAQGRVWTGAQALEIGLVDAIGSLEDAIIHAARLTGAENGLDDIRIEEYPKPMTTAEKIAVMLEDGTEMEIHGALKSIYSAFRTWNESQSGKVYARLPYAIDIR